MRQHLLPARYRDGSSQARGPTTDTSTDAAATLLLLLAVLLALSTGGVSAWASEAPPQGDMDQLAVSLAARLPAGGPDAEAALAQALRASGYSILADDGSVAPPLAAANGHLVAWWELGAMAGLARAGMVLPAEDLYALVDELAPSADGLDGRQRVLGALRAAASGRDPATRFYARFLLAMAPDHEEQAEPWPRLDDPEAELTSVQVILILHRLALDMGSLASGPGDDVSWRRPTVAVEPVFHLASRSAQAWSSIRPQPARHLSSSGAPLPSASGCHRDGYPEDMTGFLTVPMTDDERATGRTFIFEKILEDVLGVPEKVRNVLKVANFAMAYAKVAYVALAVDVLIEMDKGGRPLKRTPNTVPGEERTLTATVQYRTGELATVVNCVRTYLNMLGLDASLPADGPAEGVVLHWVQVRGHGVVGVGKPEHRIQGAGVGLRDIRDFTHSTTDAAGRATMAAVGAPQKRFFPESAPKVDKEFSVRVNLQLEPPTIRAAAGDGVGMLAGPAAALAALPASLLSKTRWISSPTFTFPVIDWSPGYVVDGFYWSAYRITGVICRLDRPFTLEADGGSITFLKGTFTMRPASASGGSWTFSGSPSAVMSVTAAGTYTVEEPEPGRRHLDRVLSEIKPTTIIRMQPGVWTATYTGPIPTPLPPQLSRLVQRDTPLGPGGKHLGGHPELIRLVPAKRECTG